MTRNSAGPPSSTAPDAAQGRSQVLEGAAAPILPAPPHTVIFPALLFGLHYALFFPALLLGRNYALFFPALFLVLNYVQIELNWKSNGAQMERGW